MNNQIQTHVRRLLQLPRPQLSVISRDEMPKFQFRERIPIDVPHTLMQLLSRFQGVRDGLPELIKNSKDQYSRLGISDPAVRTIVVVVNTQDRCVGVIDFAGATVDQFKRWETWSDPTANARDKASDIEGGHGNGGKEFMVLGSTIDSSFESCFEGRRTRMGYQNDTEKARFKPGIALDGGRPVEDQKVDSVRKRLEGSLAELGVKFKQLPKQAQDVFEARQAFTIAQVNGIKDWTRARDDTIRRLVSELPHAIELHPQAALTLESCAVWFVIDGQVLGDHPAQVRYPDPFPGFPDPVCIPVPDEVADPQTGEFIATGPSDPAKAMMLRTSAKSLRTEDMRPLHVIRVRNARNVVGLWSVADLCPGASSGYIFGEIRVPALDGEHLAGAHSQGTALTRALESWAAEEIIEYSDRIQLKLGYTKEDRDKVNKQLAKFRQLMSKALIGNRPNAQRSQRPPH